MGAVTVCTGNGDDFTCDVSAAGSASEVTIVSDFSAYSQYEAWGSYGGSLFCCVHDPDLFPDGVHIVGSDYADTLSLTYSGLTYNATGSTARSTVDGGGGNDIVRGSDSSSYGDNLTGGGGADTMTGNGGGDLITGDAGDDTMFGSAGVDVMEGAAGDDTMSGGADGDDMNGGDDHDTMTGDGGDDLMAGGADGDFMSGGEGDDYMDGGTGADVMCGDAQTLEDDLLDGDSTDEGASTDKLWGSGTDDNVNCQSSSTQVGDSSVDIVSGTCSATFLTVRPSQCP